jgi:hypothetical protein
MRTYRVHLHRDYLVEVTAKDEKDARHFVEYFLSHPRDFSTARDRERHRFRIYGMEMRTNEAVEVEPA